MGEFPYGDYTITVTYDNGETEEIALTEEMIPETDKLKFFQEGKSEITIVYEEQTTSFAINVTRLKFPENVRLNCKAEAYTYTGQPIVIEVEGDIPGGTEILYPQGNSFINANTYDMTAVLQCEGYETQVLSARIVIEKAKYDLSNAKMYDASFTYDKDAHNITVKGQPIQDENGNTIGYEPANLPKGVSVSYTIINGYGQAVNKAIDAGTYTVKAEFKGDTSNYEFNPGEDVAMATLTIKPIVYATSSIRFIGKTVMYTGESYSLTIDETTKPKNIQVTYKMTKVEYVNGNEVDVECESATLPGKYKVEAQYSFIGENTYNYTMDVRTQKAYLTIVPFMYQTSKIGFMGKTVAYTGEEYSLTVDMDNLPDNIDVSYQLIQVKDANGNDVTGESVAGNTASLPGVYKVVASFAIKSDVEAYYEMDVEEKVAYLTIQRASYDELMWEKIHMDKIVRFDKEVYTFTKDQTCVIYLIVNLPEGVEANITLRNTDGEIMEIGTVEKVEHDEEGITGKYSYTFTPDTVGTYTCVVTFEHSNEMYEPITVQLEAAVIIEQEGENAA